MLKKIVLSFALLLLAGNGIGASYLNGNEEIFEKIKEKPTMCHWAPEGDEFYDNENNPSGKYNISGQVFTISPLGSTHEEGQSQLGVGRVYLLTTSEVFIKNDEESIGWEVSIKYHPWLTLADENGNKSLDSNYSWDGHMYLFRVESEDARMKKLLSMEQFSFFLPHE